MTRCLLSHLEENISMKKILLIALLAFANTINAQGVTVDTTVHPFGKVDCGSWLNARKADSSKNIESYVLGLVDGMALGSMKNIRRGLNGISVNREQLFFWMDEWCRKNPLGTTSQGAFVFADERTGGAYGNRFKSK
jgi:hypothetical protein